MRRQLLLPRRVVIVVSAIGVNLLIFWLGIASRVQAADSEPLTRESALKLLCQGSDPYVNRVDIGFVQERFGAWSYHCRDALLYLTDVSDIDSELDALTNNDRPLEVQYRGMRLLAMRGSSKGLRLAAEWMRSESRSQRFAAWDVVSVCPNSDLVWRVLSPNLVLDLYRVEGDSTVKSKIAEVFGRHKARFAVDALCRTIADPTSRIMPDRVTSALGEIGDPRAIETLTRIPYVSADIIAALGVIRDAKGANCVIEHIDVSGAPLALARIGGPKALLALERELDHVLWQEEGDNERKASAAEYVNEHKAEVELAIAILKGVDAQGALLDAIESEECSPGLRALAWEELQRVGISDVRARFLAFYRSVMTPKDAPCEHDSSMAYCILLAEVDQSDEATEALKEHLSILCKSYAWPAAVAPDTREARFFQAVHQRNRSMVVHALHKRIGNEVFELRARLTAKHSVNDATQPNE